MLLLDESYLLSLPLPPRVVLTAVLGPRNFRFLFRRHVASLLGWTERREEDEYRGFNDSVNKFVREIWWPDEGAEALHRPRQGDLQSSASVAREVITPVVEAREQLPTSEAGEQLPRSATGKGVRGRPPTMEQQPNTTPGVQAGSSTASEAAFDQQVLLRSGECHGGRMIRQ